MLFKVINYKLPRKILIEELVALKSWSKCLP